MRAAFLPRTAARAAVAVSAAVALAVGAAGSASAATSTRTVTDGATTYQLSVTAPSSAAASGQNITVTGSGFNAGKGIYVGLCAVSGAQGANKPTPCLGGSDQSGTTGASHWVNNTFGGTLANTSKYGPGGSFNVTIHVKADLGGGQICGETVQCAVVTRADHFNSSNRKYDVHVPVTFN
ncbi:neocarzinostatin apoprotein domain-containing protein [Streptomyces sp. NPDC047014]|uniref:neocarzinostatin apoprotein domain-containing protein n=1 Tax=Streptomyces sp. NPDC047014 TaxID=3155736 RepID=UPI0033FF03BA